MGLVMGPTVLVLSSYFCGAIPFGVLIGNFFYKTDIRRFGSKNTGATNVWRVLGAKAGATTLFLDILKGAIPVTLSRTLYADNSLLAILCGMAAIVGHNWSLFLKGSGGKGVATSAGVFIALIPAQAGLALATFALFFFSTRYVSIGSIMGALSLLASCFVFETPASVKWFVFVAAVLLILKHVPNIKRLIKGEELKVKWR